MPEELPLTEQVEQNMLQVLTREGVLISKKFSYPRFNAKLKPEDVGLDSEQICEDLMSLGSKKLLTKAKLKPITLLEGEIQAYIEKHSYQFIIPGLRFVPNAKLDEVYGAFQAFNQRVRTLAQEFKNSAPAAYAEALAAWREAAAKLFPEDPESAEAMVQRIQELMPEIETLPDRFKLEFPLFNISTLDASMSMTPTDLGQQMAVAESRRRVAQEAGDQLREGVNAFVRDAVATMREQTAELCADMLKSINESETGVHGKTLARLTRFIDHFQTMNFTNDTELSAMLAEARETLLSRTADQYRNDEVARASLVAGLGSLRDKARELARNSDGLVVKFGQLGQRKFAA